MQEKNKYNFDQNMLDELAISEAEYALILEKLGREPNRLELGLFGSLWSEHCGYKHSKLLLSQFKSDNPRLLVNPGDENAGVVDIGDGLAIVFKIESHNHPSAIEPYEGAATGVGGIVRDIFAMGARPVALLNSLRFGSLEDLRTQYLFDGVVSGISGYGNCIGVPNIGGESVFSDSYTGNPLVNAMCIGLLETRHLTRATSGPPGNLLLLIGSGTGKDGIHGASGLASRSFDDDRELRPTVQVGNPFLEKILIESCLEAAISGKIDGMQDLGAAGFTSAAVECALNGSSGIEIDVGKIPRRDAGMEPYEVMLSETQERMLISVSADCLKEVKGIFDNWDIENSVIGSVTNDGNARILENGEVVADVPVSVLTDPPLYRLQGTESDSVIQQRQYDLTQVKLTNLEPEEVLKKILKSPNVGNKESVYRRYDHQVQTNTVVPPGHDAALIRVKGSNKGIAASTDGNGRFCYLDPYVGGMIAVAEACRNVACTGAEPIALTNCLNFGNPEKPEVYYQLEMCIKGMADASRKFDSPVISGNVSLYNETRDDPIYPTPVVGAVGLTEDVAAYCSVGFKNEGDQVVLIGADILDENPSVLAGSEYLEVIQGLVAGSPRIVLENEIAVQEACRQLISEKVIHSAHDLSIGGLAVSLAESSVKAGLGFESTFSFSERWDCVLFGEQQSRIVVSLPESNRDVLKRICSDKGVPYLQIGEVKGANFTIDNLLDVPVVLLKEWWDDSLKY